MKNVFSNCSRLRMCRFMILSFRLIFYLYTVKTFADPPLSRCYLLICLLIAVNVQDGTYMSASKKIKSSPTAALAVVFICTPFSLPDLITLAYTEAMATVPLVLPPSAKMISTRRLFRLSRCHNLPSICAGGIRLIFY